MANAASCLPQPIAQFKEAASVFCLYPTKSKCVLLSVCQLVKWLSVGPFAVARNGTTCAPVKQSISRSPLCVCMDPVPKHLVDIKCLASHLVQTTKMAAGSCWQLLILYRCHLRWQTCRRTLTHTHTHNQEYSSRRQSVNNYTNVSLPLPQQTADSRQRSGIYSSIITHFTTFYHILLLFLKWLKLKIVKLAHARSRSFTHSLTDSLAPSTTAWLLLVLYYQLTITKMVIILVATMFKFFVHWFIFRQFDWTVVRPMPASNFIFSYLFALVFFFFCYVIFSS